MLDLIKNNQKYLEKLNLFIKNNVFQEEISKKLNEEKLIIVSWLRWTWKANIINNIIQKSNYKNNYFYFNKDLDYNNNIKSIKDFILLFNTYIKRYNKASIVILENSHNIEWFKDFLSKLYNENYKIIIIWNDIKISWKPKVSIYPLSIKQLKTNYLEELNITNILKYWTLQEVILLKEEHLKTSYLKSQKSDIILNDIIKAYSLKNIELYNYTIIFLSLLNTYKSLRELNKKLNNNIKISLITMIEYVDYSIEAWILYRMYKYDLKQKKEISSKAKYYFSDTWIRNSLNWFTTDTYILKENLIYNELLQNWYIINWWINWKFEFSFIARKENKKSNKIEIDTKYIHLSKQISKEEIKKEVRKLIKIPLNLDIIEWKDSIEIISKYLIVENIKEIWLKKLQYENVKIVDFEKFIKEVLV